MVYPQQALLRNLLVRVPRASMSSCPPPLCVSVCLHTCKTFEYKAHARLDVAMRVAASESAAVWSKMEEALGSMQTLRKLEGQAPTDTHQRALQNFPDETTAI